MEEIIDKLTRALKAFLSARLAALRTCRGVLSSLRTDESISMYSGYMETKNQQKMLRMETEPKSGIHSYHERRPRAFERHLDAYWHLRKLEGYI